MELLPYLKKHTIVFIGNSSEDKCLISEMIPDNDKEVIKTILDNNCYISEIRWWDRVLISLGSSIGYGGPVDPRNPQEYFFAETDEYTSFEVSTSLSEYFEYLDKIKAQYKRCDIYPSFDVYRK